MAGDETDAQLAVIVAGELVVDLRTEGTPADALFQVFSVSKAITTFVLMRLVESGDLHLDRPVCEVWPEFAANGKRDITLRQIASHQAGLPAFDVPVTVEDLQDWFFCSTQLARQSPRWSPGRAHGYHAITVGYLVGEVVRRATGVTVGAHVQELFARPLKLSTWIGLPPGEASRVREFVDVRGSFAGPPATELSLAVGENPPLTDTTFNSPALWGAEVPAAGAISDARSLARLFASAVDVTGTGIAPHVLDDFVRPQASGHDLVLTDQPTRFGTGFLLPSPRSPMLTSHSFGHDGRGGALAFADRRHGLAYAYVSSRALLEAAPDRRHARVLAAIRDSLDH